MYLPKLQFFLVFVLFISSIAHSENRIRTFTIQERITLLRLPNNNSFLITGSRDGWLKTRDISDFSTINEVKAFSDNFSALDISSDDTKILTSNDTGDIAIWDSATLRNIAFLSAPFSQVFHVKYFSTSSSFIVASRNRVALMSETGDVIRSIEIDQSGISQISISSNNSLIAVGLQFGFEGNSGRILLFEAATGNLLRRIDLDRNGGVTSLAFSQNSQMLLTGNSSFPTNRSSAAVIRDVVTGDITNIFGSINLSNGSFFTKFIGKDDDVLVASDIGQLKVYSLKNQILYSENVGEGFHDADSSIINGNIVVAFVKSSTIPQDTSIITKLQIPVTSNINSWNSLK